MLWVDPKNLADAGPVLADALALADEEKPDQIISMATLTGALTPIMS